MKNSLLLPALFFISSFVQAQHGTATHHINDLDPWAISLSIVPEQTKVSTKTGTVMGYTVGGQLGYFLNENMWLTAGVTYSRKGFNDNNIPSIDSSQGIHTNINYFEVPLYFSFRTGNFAPKHGVHSAKKVGLVISAGPVAGLVWDGNISGAGMQGHQLDKNDIKNAGYKNTIGFQASLGGYFQLSKSVFITLEPSYKMTFSSNKWSSIGLRLNIWYRLLGVHPL